MPMSQPKRPVPFVVGFSLVASLAALGCGSSPPKPQNALQAELVGAPAWAKAPCQTTLQDKKGICGVGSVSGMSNIALARSAAEGRARTDLARTLQVRVKAMLKDYQAATQGGPDNRTASELHVEDVSKQITDTTLSGTRVQDTWISDTGTYWAMVMLDTDAFKDSIQNMKQLDDRLRAAIVHRADHAFSELDQATAP